MNRYAFLGSLCLCTLLGACGGGSPAPVSTPIPVPSLEALRAEVDAFRVSRGLPGMSVTIVNEDKIETVVSGVRRAGMPGAVMDSDPFQVGSQTKAATATLISRLVEQNKLSYEATLSELFPAWRAQMLPAWHSVTVRQLLQHRSGLKRDIEDLDAAQLMPHATGDMTVDRGIVGRFMLGQQPEAAPNSAYLYSNLGYLLLGLIAETAAGATYENLMAREIFAPLQMKADFGLPDNAGPQFGHEWTGSSWQVAHTTPVTQMWLGLIQAAGGMRLSMADYGIYLREHLRGLQGKSVLLNQASFTMAHTPVQGYGFGWAVQNHPQMGNISFHAGSIGTSYAMAVMIPGRNRAVAVSCNCYGDAAVAQLDAFVLTLVAKR